MLYFTFYISDYLQEWISLRLSVLARSFCEDASAFFSPYRLPAFLFSRQYKVPLVLENNM